MSDQFRGRTVIVTGASRGIGAAIACRFAADGAEVMLIGRTLSGLQSTEARIAERGGRSWAYRADIGDFREIDRAADAATERWNRVDVLVNNAGVAERAPFVSIGRDSWDRVLAVNLRAPFLLSQRIARAMIATGGGGVILNVASVAAFVSSREYASYSVSKAGLVGLTRAMAVELGEHGIRVNAVCPGLVKTDMLAEALTPEQLDAAAGKLMRVPLRRLITCDEIADVCSFLASKGAAGLTGACITVDGGLTVDGYSTEAIATSASTAQ